jgi:hypothetical protein
MLRTVAFLLCILWAGTNRQALAQQPKPLKEVISIPLQQPGLVSGNKAEFVMSADGKWFAMGWLNRVQVYSLPEAKVTRELKVVGFPKLAVSADGGWLAVTAADPKPVCRTYLFDTKDWQEQKVLEHHERWRFGGASTALSRDAKYLCLAEADGAGVAIHLEVLDVASGKAVIDRKLEPERHTVFPTRVQFSDDGKRLALQARKLELIDVESGKVTTAKEYQKEMGTPIHFTNWSEKLIAFVVAEFGGSVAMFSDSTGAELSRFSPFDGFDVSNKKPAKGYAQIAAASADGKCLIVCGHLPEAQFQLPSYALTARIRVYDQKGKVLGEAQPAGTMKDFSASRDGRYFMTNISTGKNDGKSGVRVYQLPGAK